MADRCRSQVTMVSKKVHRTYGDNFTQAQADTSIRNPFAPQFVRSHLWPEQLSQIGLMYQYIMAHYESACVMIFHSHYFNIWLRLLRKTLFIN